MGKNMDLNGLNDRECTRIYEVIERDSMLRTREQQRLSQIEEELNTSAAKRNILANQKAFNEKHCILCCSAFNFLFNKKLICNICKFNVCRNCAYFESKTWICRVCEKQRYLYFQSCKWQCNADYKNDNNIHFGSAKLCQPFINHCNIDKSSDSDCVDVSIVKTIMKENKEKCETFTQQNGSENCENSDQNTETVHKISEMTPDYDNSTLIEVREHIEAMVEGFLGESLDSAHVDKPYDDIKYLEFLNNHRDKLTKAILELTQALYLTMTNKASNNSPTNAHVILKNCIIQITEDSYNLPNLTKIYSNNTCTENNSNFISSIRSYEELLATAIINQLVEVRQSRYNTDSTADNVRQTPDTTDSGSENMKSTRYSEISYESDLADGESVFSYNDPSVIITGSNIDLRSPLTGNLLCHEPAYVLQEQIEEITTTKSYSDVEDVSVTNDEPMPMHFVELNPNVERNPLKVPFPEAGIDIVDINSCHIDDEDISEDSGIKLIDIQNWEENWLFRKKKKSNESNIMYGYMSLALAERPVSMLVPNPSQTINAMIGSRDIDELSELSEHNSVGSLEFSDDESEKENEEELYQNGIVVNLNTESAVEVINNKKANQTNVTLVKSVKKVHKPVVNLEAIVPKFLPIEQRDSKIESEYDPYFMLRPGDAYVQSGIVVQFCCKAKGTKPLLYCWFKNGNLLNCSQNIRIFQSGDDSVLEIKQTSISDSAQYSCVVYNHCGYQWCDFNFKVRNYSFSQNKLSEMNKRMRKQEEASKAKHEIKGVSTKTTINSKHEKSPPLVIQRTWADRVAELQNPDSKTIFQDYEELPSKREKTDEHINQENGITIEFPLTGTIAEREHKKWESPDIEIKDNPYSTENINLRIQKRALITDNESPEAVPERDQEENDPSFFSFNTKDLTRYKRNYYIPENYNKEETLRSFDENEYSNTKYFNENLIQQVINDDNESKIELNNNSTADPLRTNDSIDILLIPKESESTLPSVKDLVNKFTANSTTCDETDRTDNGKRDSFSDDNIDHLPKKIAPRMAQLSNSNFKVHSLTARSMSREFRELSQLNIPRKQNRVPINGKNSTIAQTESEPSTPSTACSPTNEGYASDESNTSSVASNTGNPSVVGIQSSKDNVDGRKLSQSILKRAKYWEKRCEQGLISDSSVSEHFPQIED